MGSICLERKKISQNNDISVELKHLITFLFYNRLLASFPYDTGHPFFYTVSYIWCISFIVYAIHAIAAMDSLFCWFIFNISAHFRALQRELETVVAASAGAEDDSSLHSSITQTLHYHRRIMELSAEFDELYAPIVFIEISVSYLKLCFSAYNLINLGDISGLPVIAVGLVTITFQLCIYCFSGEKIKNVVSLWISASGLLKM